MKLIDTPLLACSLAAVSGVVAFYYFDAPVWLAAASGMAVAIAATLIVRRIAPRALKRR